MDIINKAQRLAAPTMRGLASQFSPQITKGLLIEYLSKVELSDIMTYVEKNTSLWSQMTPEYQAKAKKVVKMQGGLNWLTSEWLIEAVRKDIPRLASLFLGWQKARNWLDRQVIDLKERVSA